MEKRLQRMSKQKWAAIVYGRSYQVDFRFIALPQDFTEPKKNWAAQYILATLNNANKLSGSPRWSLFKDESHCVIGVTCMVRDLLQDMAQETIELFSKDNQGRPLYVFVGYVAQIDCQPILDDFPPYTELHLQSFQNLYQYIINVWQIEEYLQDSKKPIFNQYQPIAFDSNQIKLENTSELATQINHQQKDPHHIYLWQNDAIQKQNLWATAAVCQQPISLCLGEPNLKKIRQSPFLNQIVTQDFLIAIQDFLMQQDRHQQAKLSHSKKLSQLIIDKVKNDLDITLQNLYLLKNKSHHLLTTIGDRSEQTQLSYSQSSRDVESLQSDRSMSQLHQDSNFGFKTKSSLPEDSHQKDWF